MIAGWLASPARRDGPGAPGLSGSRIVVLMLVTMIGAWMFFAWLASSRFGDLHVVTLRSEYPGEVRVLTHGFGADAWEVGFLAAHAQASRVTEEQWRRGRSEAAWLAQGFHSGRSLRRTADGGCTYRVQFRDGNPHDGEEVDVAFAGGRETELVVRADGSLAVSGGSQHLPEWEFLRGAPEPVASWPRRADAGERPDVPDADDPLLPARDPASFREPAPTAEPPDSPR